MRDSYLAVMLRTHSIHTDKHRRAAWSYSLLSYVQANPAVTHQDLCCAVLYYRVPCPMSVSHVPPFVPTLTPPPCHQDTASSPSPNP